MYLSFFFLALLLLCALGVVPPLLSLMMMFLFTLIGLINLSRPWSRDTFWESASPTKPSTWTDDRTP